MIPIVFNGFKLKKNELINCRIFMQYINLDQLILKDFIIDK